MAISFSPSRDTAPVASLDVYKRQNHILLYLYLEFGQKASMEEITVYHPDVIAFDPGGGNFIHA